MRLPDQLADVDPIVASFCGGAVGVVSGLLVVEVGPGARGSWRCHAGQTTACLPACLPECPGPRRRQGCVGWPLPGAAPAPGAALVPRCGLPAAAAGVLLLLLLQQQLCH
jgi:hypothetical protein